MRDGVQRMCIRTVYVVGCVSSPRVSSLTIIKELTKVRASLSLTPLRSSRSCVCTRHGCDAAAHERLCERAMLWHLMCQTERFIAHDTYTRLGVHVGKGMVGVQGVPVASRGRIGDNFSLRDKEAPCRLCLLRGVLRTP
jgi:hypothetical protein